MKISILNHKVTLALLSLLVVAGCQKRDIPLDPQEIEQRQEQPVTQYNWIDGEAYIKVSESGLKAGDQLASSLRSSLRSLRGADKSEITISHVFEIGGEYEAAQRRHGLHRWLKITFDESMDVNEVLTELQKRQDVEVAHGALPITRNAVTYTPLRMSDLESNDIRDFNGGYSKFDKVDPLLKHQWHYVNNGYDGGFYSINFTQGADINLFKAWEVETGKKSVIVAVIDSGVDYNHPDLQESMWSDPDVPGSHGYNFFLNTPTVEPDFHGTHVAGTIAARNNNGIGVSGVAGGNGDPDSGVRIMSLQIFKKTNHIADSQTAGYEGIGNAFKFAAEHGAVIANCSWGFSLNDQSALSYPDEVPQLIKEGIDYFISVAGTDGKGNQKADSPMKGGVVFFASGNDGQRNKRIVPSYYEPVIAVGAFNREFKVTDYTNTGDWVDILAPGGETMLYNNTALGTGILSTITSDFGTYIMGTDFYGNNQYGRDYLFPDQQVYAFAQGTSMATPHVTGIAALVVSKFGDGQKGFTNEDLKKRILGAIKPINHEEKNGSLRGTIGRGYIDAQLALEENKKQAPQAVDSQKIESEPDYFTNKMTWTAAQDNDAIYGTAISYKLYLSETSIEAGKISELTPVVTIPNGTAKVGEPLEYTFIDLKDGTTYHVAIVAVDRWGLQSPVTHYQFTTKLNHAPVIEGMPESITLKKTDPYYKMTVTLSDQEDSKIIHAFEGDEQTGINIIRNGNVLDITIVPQLPAGQYTYTLKATDSFGKETSKSFTLTIVSYTPPTLVGSVDNVSLTMGEAASTIDLGALFKVSQGLTPTYTVESGNPNVVEATITEDGHRLTLTPKGEGVTSVTIRINDGQTTRSTSFEVTVNTSSKEEIKAIYPIPAHSYVKILAKRGIPTLSVTVTTARGEILVQEQLLVNERTNEATLHTDRLAPGVYTLHINTGTSVVRRTIVKK